MQIDTFKSIVSTFADPGSELIFDRQRMMFPMNGDVVDVEISSSYGDIHVNEGNGAIPASRWIVERLAKLQLLSSRILEQIPQHTNFVSPAADLLPTLEASPDGNEHHISDALSEVLDTLSTQSPLETTVLYITSDAGEGKTSLINAAARKQAADFSAGRSNWLLVPIILGGRHFLRFDDITVGALQNKYRFPFLYYNSFLALVRMGVIIPAFDGFEEMFVENSSGEALSAMGILVGALNSTGTVTVAARKAYFEFENLRSQEKLYDTISSYSVGFSKLELNRWKKEQFLRYCQNRTLHNAAQIYERVSERLGADHSLLTRPVLVRRLVDIAQQSLSLESFIEQIHSSGSDFFSVFVRSIIEREANEKWIDRSGEMGATLITVEEHCELLSLIAINMWEGRIEYLKQDHLDVVTEYFCESKRKSALQSQQVRDRIRGHALLIASSDVNQAVEFDHDEFRQYFLGDGLAHLVAPLSKSAASETLSVLRRGILPENSQLEFIRAIKRESDEKILEVAKFLAAISKLDGQASYTKENCGNLALKLVSDLDSCGLKLEEMVFGIDTVRDCKLKNIVFSNCYFSQSSYDTAEIESCTFDECTFGQLRIFPSTDIRANSFLSCTIDSIRLEETGLELWEPGAIKSYLEQQHCTFTNGEAVQSVDMTSLTMDEKLISVEKLFRYFMRSTHISESVIRIKLGDRGQTFIDYTLPDLIAANIVEEIENRGSGQQRRFKLGRPLQLLNTRLSEAQGSYQNFISGFS